ncbi:MAG: pyridoxal phosphate-dependent aminotransferase [Bacteroidetes bacterium]|nr:MAG: pyridoxal phosphate-dependent aminotransferase [Bacteroidota bacterium]TAF90638.1 MAG: pyridoxal phosphate-dependent aminotransferase [Bacteroidota bacterium]
MNVASRLQGIGEYFFSQKLREIEQLKKAGKPIINLGIGSPDLPPHPAVIEALTQKAVLTTSHAYQGYKGVPALRAAIANFYQNYYQVVVDAEQQVLPLLGSKEGIMHVAMTFFEPGTTVAIPNPGYPTYKAAFTIAGAHIVQYDALENPFPTVQQLHALHQKTPLKGVVVNTPHMPTGLQASDEDMTNLVQWAVSNNVLILHDNPYSFIRNTSPKSLLSVAGAWQVVLELNSLSKSHNMAGWRVGMLVANASLLQQVLTFKSNMDSGMFLPVQLAAAAALQLPQSWFDGLNKEYEERAVLATEILQTVGCTIPPKQVGMFVWAAIPKGWQDGFAVSDALLHQANVFITPGGIFGTNGNNFLRISLCSNMQQLQTCLERVQAWSNQ